jgi:hypothetical protein
MGIAGQALTGADLQAFLKKMDDAILKDAQKHPWDGTNERALNNQISQAIADALNQSTDQNIFVTIGQKIKNRI